jgi:D-alanine-D-alanine ligase
MGPMLIRPLQASDRPAIVEMLAACGAFNAAEVQMALELLDAGLTQGDYTLLGVEVGGKARAYVCAGHTPLTQTTWDLYWMCVHPASQRAGVGRALLARAEACILEHGGERIRVETSGRGDYARARRFYGAAGYCTIGVIRHFYRPGDDCVVLCKELKTISPMP